MSSSNTSKVTEPGRRPNSVKSSKQNGRWKCLKRSRHNYLTSFQKVMNFHHLVETTVFELPQKTPLRVKEVERDLEKLS